MRGGFLFRDAARLGVINPPTAVLFILSISLISLHFPLSPSIYKNVYYIFINIWVSYIFVSYIYLFLFCAVQADLYELNNPILASFSIPQNVLWYLANKYFLNNERPFMNLSVFLQNLFISLKSNKVPKHIWLVVTLWISRAGEQQA